jgi:hypothetical protein
MGCARAKSISTDNTNTNTNTETRDTAANGASFQAYLTTTDR